MSCEESETTASLRGGRRPLSPAAEPLEDEDLLSEILLRLPPLPSPLPRASAVCTRWRGLVSDPRFIRRFHLRHRGSPPLLGFFDTDLGRSCITFVPALQFPNRVPTQRLSLQIGNYASCSLLDCRHGLVLILQVTRDQAIVWDPVAGDEHSVALPTGFDRIIHGAVLRAATNIQHFKVVLVSITKHQPIIQLIASVYSSETGVWGDLVSTPLPGITFLPTMQPAMVRNHLYWPFAGSLSGIFEFDLDHQSLAVIPMPEEYAKSYCLSRVTRAEGYGLGLLTVRLDCSRAQLWKREFSCDGVASWVLRRTVELDKLLSLNSVERRYLSLLGLLITARVF